MKWFSKGIWIKRLKDGYQNMSREHRKEFRDQSWQEHLKREYENALEFYSVDGKPWEELSQDQKDSVEITVKQNAQEMHEFGKSLSAGIVSK